MARVKGKTESGFEYEIDDRVRKDRRTARILCDLFSGDIQKQTIATVTFADAILGRGQADAMEEHFRALNDGFCDEDTMDLEVMEIFKGTTDYSGEESKEAKNS